MRRLIKQDFDRAFEQCQAIVCPTTPDPAFRFGEKTDDPLSMYLNDVYTVGAPLAGIPGISIPGGVAERDGKTLPIGLQLLGPTFSEHQLLKVAKIFESMSPYAGLRPAMG